MIIETTTGVQNDPFAFLDKQIVSVTQDPISKMGAIQLMANSEFMRINMPYEELLEIFKNSQSRDYFTDEVKQKSEQKKFDPVTVGAHKFKIDIRSTEYEDGESSVLQLYTNFELKGEEIKEVIKSVEGVSSSLEYLHNRYESPISVGKMFDAELVRQNLENNLIMYLKS